MYFDILMLRVLRDQPRHGYEIKKQVERILGGRSINNNVLYPALRRFEEQGAVERAAAEADPGRPPRNVYRLTDTGYDLFQSMIRDADPALLADDNEFQVRVAFFDDVPPEDRLRDHRGAPGHRRRPRSSTSTRSGRTPRRRPWGLRVMDFHRDNARRELRWLDDLATAAAGGTP